MGHHFFLGLGGERGGGGVGWGVGISSCYGGVGAGHTRETERIKEKMNIAKEERARWYQEETSNRDGQAAEAERERDTHRLRL